MRCPDCLLGQLEYREADWWEEDGEHFYDSWWQCSKCGNKFTQEELDIALGLSH
jgi:rubredoxin